MFPAVLTFLFCQACQNTSSESGSNADAGPRPDTIRLDPVPTEGAVPFTVTDGTVYWSAKKAIGDPHQGTIAVSGGELMVNQGRLLSGAVTMDMQSIAVSNMNDGGERKTLEAHLKDKDFFEVKRFPSAEFVLEEILPSNLPAFNWVVRGNLTIKGQSHPVNVPVRLDIDGDKLKAESASFILNRTQWGLNFRSGILGTAKDKIIEDIVPVSLKITAVRKE